MEQSVRDLLDAVFEPDVASVVSFIELLRGCGGLVIHTNGAGQTIATGAAQKFTLWESAFPEAGGVFGHHSENRIIATCAGLYLLGWHMCFAGDKRSAWRGHIYVDGVGIGIDWARDILPSESPGSVSSVGLVTVPLDGIIEAYLEHDNNGDVVCTPAASQMYAVRVA